ncbi:MAG: selenium-dependent molybdenum cofactor biosynthesis protein YqeB [Chloroflexi bacterium]|nr:selenium-dependent molybdenum cofactor biosynthesis protein YqeB [Chloroflexota bacterium]MCL5276121.1 selenium-dependent molybdenum cofactor biosynthesis protein YqeB [Chloroflexota bacterium]
MRTHPIAVVKGAGDLGTGAAYRLWRAGFHVLCTDLPQPLAIRRSVAIASAIYDARMTIDGAMVERIIFVDEAVFSWQRNSIPVVADAATRSVRVLRPEVVVDAIMAKQNTGTQIDDAPVVIGLGPGFSAGQDCHAVIETMRGHNLGRVIWNGGAAANTGVPGNVGGADAQRIVRAPCAGQMYGRKAIGDIVKPGDIIAQVGATVVTAPLGGVLRGLLHDGVAVVENMKIGDIDPRAEVSYCYSISDKSLAVGGGVLEAVFALRDRWQAVMSTEED